MKSAFAAIAGALVATEVASHATFQQLWVNGVDMGQQCIRLPGSNTPVTNVAGNDVRCNVGGARGVPGKCEVAAGQTVTIEMHQQNGDRSCRNEAIGGAHYGPVMAYLSKVPDAARADGSSGWFKIYESGWAAKSGAQSANDDFWGVKDMIGCCGRVDVKIPIDVAPGDYLLRGEVIALHTAGSPSGAQLYMSCYQLVITGNGTATPPTVKFPGAYKSSDPGLLFNIHQKANTYVVPGPSIYSRGVTKSAGSGCGAGGCMATCTAGVGPTGKALLAQATGAAELGPAGVAGCASVRQVQAWQQCGGAGFANDGCVECPSGFTCKTMNNNYAQCAQ